MNKGEQCNFELRKGTAQEGRGILEWCRNGGEPNFTGEFKLGS